MALSDKLENLGFTSNEVKVYLTLLRIGEAKAGRISELSNLERTSTYNALARLVQHGLVSHVFEGKHKIFSAANPNKILAVFKEREERASLLLPELLNLRQFDAQKEVIQKFRGFAGVKTVLNDVMDRSIGKEYLMFGSENQLSERMPTFSRIFVARKDKKKIKARFLVRSGRKGSAKSKYTQIRYVDYDVISPAVTTVYDKRVCIIIWSEIPEAIIIDDPLVSAAYRSYFEFMWKHANK